MAPMLRDDVLGKIAAHEAELRAMGVKRLLLFGSVARGQERAESDVDFLVEFDGRAVGYFHLFKVQRQLEEWVGRKVDLGTVASLRREASGTKCSPRQCVQRRDWRLQAADIVSAAERLERYTRDAGFEQFQASEQLIAAVSYELLVIGEAAKSIPAEVQAAAPALDWAGMRGMRNVVAHELLRRRPQGGLGHGDAGCSGNRGAAPGAPRCGALKLSSWSQLGHADRETLEGVQVARRLGEQAAPVERAVLVCDAIAQAGGVAQGGGKGVVNHRAPHRRGGHGA